MGLIHAMRVEIEPATQFNMVLEPIISKPILPPQKHTLRFTSETQMELSAPEALSYKLSHTVM